MIPAIFSLPGNGASVGSSIYCGQPGWFPNIGIDTGLIFLEDIPIVVMVAIAAGPAAPSATAMDWRLKISLISVYLSALNILCRFFRRYEYLPAVGVASSLRLHSGIDFFASCGKGGC